VLSAVSNFSTTDFLILGIILLDFTRTHLEHPGHPFRGFILNFSVPACRFTSANTKTSTSMVNATPHNLLNLIIYYSENK
jgi:hypothetical protein